jgi:hypothetical protein
MLRLHFFKRKFQYDIFIGNIVGRSRSCFHPLSGFFAGVYKKICASVVAQSRETTFAYDHHRGAGVLSFVAFAQFFHAIDRRTAGSGRGDYDVQHRRDVRFGQIDAYRFFVDGRHNHQSDGDGEHKSGSSHPDGEHGQMSHEKILQ